VSEEIVHVYPNTPFSIRYSKNEPKPGCWSTVNVRVFRDWTEIGSYERGYDSFIAETFCPFKSNGKWYALYSAEYTCTRVALLEDKFEDWCGEKPSSWGFCPIELWVPQYYEYQCESNQKSYKDFIFNDYEDTNESFMKEAAGSPILFAPFGFISGCVWGDDSCWKLRFVDLRYLEDKRIVVNEKDEIERFPDGRTVREQVGINSCGSLSNISLVVAQKKHVRIIL
jgi:hypothetical protein